MASWKSKNDTKFSGDEPGVGIIITAETWAAIRAMPEPGRNGSAVPLVHGDRIYVSDAAMSRVPAR
jgi:hypothetical protein